MTISTIGSTIPQGITLGTGTYADQITVTSTGTVMATGEDAGVLGKDAGIILTNAGRLEGYDGVYLYNGNGTVVNQAGGFIGGNRYGIASGNLFSGGAGDAPSAIFNAGTINGGIDGLALYSGGNVTNTGSIHGGFTGVYIYGAATLFNSGTITGSTAHGAVKFSGHGDDRLILASTAQFYGAVIGSSGFNTVELTSGSTAGTIANFNAEYKYFRNAVLDRGAAWTISSNAAYDTFDLLGVTQANIVETEAGGALTFTAGTGELVVENEPEAVFTLSNDGAGGTDITYLPGAISTITTTLTSNTTFGLGNYNADLTVSNTGAVITPNSGNYALTGVIGGVILTNFGSIAGPGVGGVSLRAGGTVSNALGGVIEASGGHSGALVIGGGLGEVTNAGTIGDIYNGVVLYAGGEVENTGTITGAGATGVYIAGGGTVYNAGTITGATSVRFTGNAADRLIITPHAVLSGTAYGGSGSSILELASGAPAGFIADLDNEFRNFSNIAVDTDANWTIASDALNDTFDLTGVTQGNVIQTFDNGALTITGGGDTLVLDAVVQGEFSLASDGAAGTDIVYVPGAISTITTTLTAPITFGAGNYNANLTIATTGAIIPSAEGVAYAAVANANGVRLTNFGTLHSSGDVVLLHGSGTLVNASGAQINNNFESGSGVFIDGAGLVENAGTIFGNSDGVALFAGGTIVNTGSIQGNGNVAVYLAGGGTIENSGIIKGAHAVQFSGSAADLLIIAPGAVFQGSVAGGTGTNTLELASAASTGTISSLGTQFTGFRELVVDAGANWVLTGANTIASIGGGGALTLGNAASLTVSGSLSPNLTVDFSGLSGTLSLDDVSLAQALITNFGTGDTIDLTGITATEVGFGASGLTFQVAGMDETLDISGNLRATNFAFTSDSHGGTDITDNIITTLTTSLATGITLGSGDFLDRLFITQTGAVKTSRRAAIVSGDAAASLVNYGTVYGPSYGTSFANGGVVINAATIAGGEAVRIGNASGTLANSGLVKGSLDGVVLTAGGNVSNTGTITGAANVGVYFDGGGKLTNTGTILGAADAVQFKGAAAGDLFNSGTITGNGVYAVALGGAGAVTNAGSGLISGALGGVELTDGGFFANTGTTSTVAGAGGSAVYIIDAAGTVLNSGTLSGGLAGAYLKDGGSFSNIGTASLVRGTSHYGLLVNYGAGTVFNAGTITGRATGITLRKGGQVTNQGTISGVTLGGISLYPVGGTVTNDGLITGANYGIASGVLLQAQLAASPPVSSQITNTGTITGGTYGVIAQLGTITNNGTAALISGGKDGIYFSATGTVSVSNQGSIIGGQNGIDAAFPNGTILNSGTIIGTSQGGVILQDGGTVQNSASAALINGGVDGIRIADQSYNAAILNSGTILGNVTGITISGGGMVSNSAGGLIAADGALFGPQFGIKFSDDGVPGRSATVDNAGDIRGLTGGVDLGVAGTVINSGEIISLGDAVYFGGTGRNLLELGAGASFLGTVTGTAGAIDSLELLAGAGTIGGLGSQLLGFETIAFDPGASWDISGASTAFAGGQVITGFHLGDTLDLTGISVAVSSYVTGTGLVLTDGSAPNLTIDLAGNFTTADFLVTPDGNGGSDITKAPLCYLHGTRILTPSGLVKVEELAIGDDVVTRFGGIQRIKWLGRQNYAPRFIARHPQKWPVRIAAGALENGVPARDLWVSPGHSMLLGETLVLASNLVNRITITQPRPLTEVSYVQIELSAHDCVLAEGAWSETFADAPGLRAQFHNAAEFYALYPDPPPVEALRLCAARPERGARLEAALRPITARAASRMPPGPLEGWIDIARDWRIEGWARDLAHPGLPVLLQILIGEQVIGSVLACGFREDLRRAAKGSGHCAFRFTPPFRLRAEALATLAIRRAADGARLPGAAAVPEKCIGSHH